MDPRIQIEQFQNSVHYRLFRLSDPIPLTIYEELIGRIQTELSESVQRVLICDNHVLVQVRHGHFWQRDVEPNILLIIQTVLGWSSCQLFRARFYSMSTRMAHPNTTPRNIREEHPPPTK